MGAQRVDRVTNLAGCGTLSVRARCKATLNRIGGPRVVRIGLFWVLLAGTYLAFVGSVTLAEAAAAVLCGGLGAVWTWQLARCGDRHLHVPVSGLGPLGAAFLRLPGETVSVGIRLFRAAARGDVSGEDRSVPPSEIAGCPLGGDDPKSASARAVSVLAASLAPDAYVLRLEPERGRVLVHTILHAISAEGRAAR